MEPRTIREIAKAAMRDCGLHDGDTAHIDSFIGWVNTADRLMVTQAEVDWNRRTRHHDLIAKKRTYNLGVDMRKISAVSCVYGDRPYPLTELKDKMSWDRITYSRLYLSARPTHYYMNGRRGLELYPTPTVDVHNGLIVQYAPRLRFRDREDITTQAVANGRTNKIRTDVPIPADRLDSKVFYDGYAYGVVEIKNTESPYMVTTDEVVRVFSQDPITVVIGDVPYVPEEYNDGVKAYCSWQYYLRQKDLKTAYEYKALFEDRKRDFRDDYAETTTNYLNGDGAPNVNPFYQPPVHIVGI